MDFKLNFMGIIAADWPLVFRFYKETLSWQTHLEPHYGDWAALGGDWAMYKAGIPSVVVELFDLGRPPSAERAWGKEQNIRPSIQVADLEATVQGWQAQGVHFSGAIETAPWGERIEFTAPEGFRWSLAHVPGKAVTEDLGKPFI